MDETNIRIEQVGKGGLLYFQFGLVIGLFLYKQEKLFRCVKDARLEPLLRSLPSDK